MERPTAARSDIPRILFVHLPRTGGTAFAQDVLEANFQDAFAKVNYGPDMRPFGPTGDPREWSKERKATVRLVYGHMPFGLDKEFEDRSEYITILRDPVSRVVSDYYFCRTREDSFAHQYAMDLSLAEFVRTGLGLSHNCYARYLSSEVFGMQYSGPEEMLAAARVNLSRCSIVGFTDRMGSFVELVCRRYDLDPGVLTEAHRNAATPPGTSVSEEELAVIRECNQLDLAIYEEYRERKLAFNAQARPEA